MAACDADIVIVEDQHNALCLLPCRLRLEVTIDVMVVCRQPCTARSYKGGSPGATPTPRSP